MGSAAQGNLREVSIRRVGIEEEFLLIDPATRRIGSGAVAIVGEAEGLDPELYRHQLETQTGAERDLDEIEAQLRAARRTASAAAQKAGLVIAASGTIPLEHDGLRVSPDDRYRDMVDTFGETARVGETCGCHVHVEISSREEGVAVIDRIARWLPVLVAMTANSPYIEGRDTGYASWRRETWNRWPSAGVTEAFGSVAAYDETARLLQMTGAARDEGMLYFDARLSTGQPTVEIRVLDVCTDVSDVVLAAALIRALVATEARAWAEDSESARWRAEILRAASWRAAKLGLSSTLVHPVRRELASARDAVTALVDHVRDQLDVAGDVDRVDEGVERVLAGNGAVRQRAAYERTGSIEGVVDDLVARTRPSGDLG